MDTTTFPRPGESETQATAADGGTCGILGQIEDERVQLMGLLVRSHRRLTYLLGQELEQACGIPLVWFDVLIHIGGAPEGRLTMSKLSTDIALTTGGVTRLVDRMTEAGLVERTNCPSDRRSVHVVMTEQGNTTLAAAIAEHIAGIDRHVMAVLDENDRSSLSQALTKLVDEGC
jgi:MarR family 2-MHQ and catechol resistance regulon transcriptional repressor